MALPEDVRAPLKHLLLQTLASPVKVAASVAAQCVAAGAAIELPHGGWPELIGQLLEFVQNQENTGARIATLQTIGYVCEVVVSVERCNRVWCDAITDIILATPVPLGALERDSDCRRPGRPQGGAQRRGPGRRYQRSLQLARVHPRQL